MLRDALVGPCGVEVQVVVGQDSAQMSLAEALMVWVFLRDGARVTVRVNACCAARRVCTAPG